ncbi:MAG: lysophospholipid acyltransferase family protein [Rikenellaceae bacterium]
MISLLYYIFLVLFCTFIMLLSVVALVVCAPFDRGRRVVHWLTLFMTRIFYGGSIYWPTTVEGGENLDPKRSYVVVINHQNMMDIPTLYLLSFHFRWVSKKEVFRIPFFGQFLIIHGDIAIERGNPKVAMRKVVTDGCKWLSRGVSVAIFPEGTRSKDGEIHRFKAGAFNLAKEAGVEILPIVMEGTKSAFKKYGMFNWRNHTTLKVLPPIAADVVAQTETKELAEMIRSQMIQALNTIRKQ